MTLGTAGAMKLDDRRLDPFYAAARVHAQPVCVHVGWSYPPISELYDSVYEAMITPFVLPLFMGFSSVLIGGVLERFPKLQIGFFGAGVEWVPYWRIATHALSWPRFATGLAPRSMLICCAFTIAMSSRKMSRIWTRSMSEIHCWSSLKL